MPSPKIKSIYDALKGGGADVGTEQEFSNWFLAKGDQGYKNRKYVWDTMKAGGADVGANYEEFRDWLGLVPTKPQKAATVSQQSRQPQAAEPNRPKTTMEMAAEVGFGNFNPKAAVMPSAFQTPGAGAVINPQTGKAVQEEPNEIAETVNRYATGRVNEQDKENMRQRGQQLRDEFDYAKETGGGRLQEGNLVNIPGQVNTVARDEEGNIMRNNSGQLLRGITTDESRVLASGRYNEDVDKRLAEDENLKALKEGIEKQLLQTKDNGNEGFAELAIAHKAVKDAEELINEMNKQKRGNSIGDFFRNVWRGLKSENMFSVADDLTNNVHVMSAIDKYQSDPSSLTDAEKILLDAVAFKNVIDQEYNPQMSRAAKAGQTTGGSVTLMADIAMNPLSGLGKSMAKKVGTKVLRNAAEKAVASGAERAISKGAARAARFAAAGGNLAGNIVSAAGMTATVSSPRVISDAQQRMIGDIQSEYDENGLLRFKGTEGGDTAFDAYRKAFVSNAIENFTEIQSSMLLGAVGLAGRTIPGVRSAMNGFKATALGQMWNAAGRSQLGRMARNVAERTGLHDFPGESLEEIEGGILNAIFVGDQTIADTFEQDNLIDIGLGVAPMQMFFAAVNLGGYGYTSRRAKRALREADSECQIYFGEEGWQQMKQTIDETKDVNELKSVLSNVVNGGQYSTQAKQAAFRYAAAREGYKGAVLGEAAAQELDFGQKSRVDHTLVVDKTVTTFDKDGKELETKTFDTDDEVQGYMTEIRMRRKNDDMLSDIEAMQKKATQREAVKGDVGYTAAFSDEEWTGLMWEAMQQAGYDESRGQDDPTNQAIAANVLQVGTMENDIFKEVVNKYNPLQRLHHNVAENHGISDGELQRILDKDPLKRTDEQQAIVDEYATQLHELAYEPGEPHIEQSAQDGASAADDADGGVAGIDPAVVQSEKERYDAAIAARDEALKNNQAMAMRIEELQSYGVDAAGIIAELGEFDENDVKAVIEGYNAEYRWQSFLDKANQNFEATTQRETDRRTFKGTLNGAEQKENMVNVTDGQNTYTLVGGDVTTDADGRVTGGGNANALVVLDAEGNMTVLHPESTLTVMPGENLADWGAAFLQSLQEQGSAAVAPTEGTEGAAGGAATESPQTGQEAEGAPVAEQPAAEQPAAEQPAGEQPAEGTPVGEQPTEGAPAEGAPIGEQPAGGEPAEGEGEQPVIPTNEKGRKLYHQGVNLDVAIDDILSEEAPDNDVNALANRRIKTAQRKLDDLNKDNKKFAKQFEDQDFDDDEYDDVRAAQRGEELPYGTELGVYAQQRMEQEQIISYYNQLKSRYAARRAAEILAGEGAAGAVGGSGASGNNGNNGNNEPVGDENVPDWTVDKASDARARGYRMENGHRVDRQEPIADKQEGNETEVKFDKSEEPVKGRLTIVDSGSLIPSHVNGQRNVKYFITEAQPKERTDADSENSSTAIAENVNPEEITGGVTAYTGAPVVNSRGEVIQGNNRTIGLQKMWGNDQYGESQQKYKQYLMDHAEEFGLDAAAIEQMENPVLVRMVDVSDDEAIRLGQKTAANTESGGTERIDANRVLNQLGDKFDTFIRLLFAGAEEEDMTLMGMIVKNGVSALKWLNDGRNHAKFISDTEYQSCFDKKGNLTEEAKQDLQKIVEGMLFADAPDNLREMFYRLPAKAQNAILATFFRDAQSPKESSIIKDIQNAIEAFEVISNASSEFKAAKSVNDARVAVKDVQKQTAMFGNTGTILEKFDNFALELAIIFKAMKQNTIRDYFNAYYDAVQGKGGDIFSEAVTKTKAEAIRDIFGVETNNQEINDTEGEGPLEGGSNDGTGGEPGNAGESGNGEPPAQGEQPAVGGGGTAGTGEVSEREQWIADHPLTEAEIDASDAPQMRKNLAKGYLNGSNDSQLAKAAYTSIYNKKGSPTQALPSREEGAAETPGTATGSQPTGQAETPQGEVSQGEVPASGGQSAAGGMSAATAAANAKVQAILARMKKHGNRQQNGNADAYSIAGLTDEQIDDMLELVEAGAELGYTLLDGVQTKDEWTAQMRGLIGESLKDATGYTDVEVDELLEDLWNAPYENEWGDTNTIAEYAAEKGIITTNNNNNGTEEGTGNGDTGTSGRGVVGSGPEGGVGENAPNNGGSTGTGGETGSGTVVSGGNSGSGEGRGRGSSEVPSKGLPRGEQGEGDKPVQEGRPSSEEPGVAATNTGGSTGERGNRSGANGKNGANDGGGSGLGGESPAVSGTNPSVGQPERVEPKKPLADVSQEKTPYVPASIGGKYAIGSVVPSGVADAIAQAFKRLREQHKKEILDFVRDELGYSSNEEMLSDFDSGKTDGLAAEQVDAVALAISAMKSGKSFIVGDMTGVGKGRTAAALIRWGKKNGKKVLFVTEKAPLFTDMYRDMVDIGSGELLPFVTNSDSDANITDADGNKVIPKPSSAAQKALWDREDDVLPRDKKGRQYDFVMTTYSQVARTDKDTSAKKAEWLQRYAKDAIVIMDESHNASGDSNTGRYFKELVSAASGVTFLSATYAKRPDNMLLYALRSSMSETHMSTGDMLQAIKDYGVPMQEMMAAALYGSGEMIRRERDMSDVKTTWTDPKVIYSEEEYEQCRKTSDKTMDLVNAIIDFQRDYIDDIVKEHQEEYDLQNKAAALTGGPETTVDNTHYSGQVSNIVNLMTYAMKAKKAAQMAIEQIKQGKKPVIAVENTLDSYIKELPDEMDSADFGPIFEKGIKFALKYTITVKGKNDEGKKVILSQTTIDAEEELNEAGQRALANLRKRAEDYLADRDKLDLSLSPIDLVKQMIADAGYSCGEITGRSTQLERKPGGGFRKVPIRIKKKDVARRYNGGSKENPLPEKEQYQALVINVAGATGISLHSSKKFGNQQPRTMIILQPNRDVNKEVQMRGRIDRTGQVHRGEYFYVTSPIPAEQKMTMMLKQKLASLDAQSVGTKNVSSNKVEGQDMDNKYGDEVCKNFLLEHLQDINALLDNGLKHNNKTRQWEGRPGLLYDVLINIQRLPCEMQEMILNELTQRYQDQIDYLNQNGINDLETTTMNLEAETIDKATFVKGKDNESVNEFAHDTTIERVEVNVLKKPMRSSDIKKKMKDLDALDEDGLPKEGVFGDTDAVVKQKAIEIVEERKAKFEEQEKKLEERIRAAHPRKEDQSEEEWETQIRDWPTLQTMRMKHKSDLYELQRSIQDQYNNVWNAARYLKPGRPYLVPLTDDVGSDSMSMYGRFLGFQLKDGTPNKVQAVFAVKDSRVMISVPVVNQQRVIQKILSDRNDIEITALERTEWGEDLTMEQKAKKWDEWWDKMIPKNTNRQIRYMITGNVLQACGSLGKYKGQIVTFTRRNKETGEITLERGMLLAENFDPENFKVRRAVVKKDIWEHYDEVKDEKSNISCSRQGDTLIVKFEKRKGEKLTDHPANKDATLKALAMNGEIRPSGKTAIMCVVKEANVDKALEHLYKEYGYTKEELFVMPDSTEKPDAIVRTNRPYQEVIDQFKDKYGSEWLIDSKIKQMLKRYRMDVNNEGLKQEIREAVQLRQAYLRKRYAQEESNRLAWQVLIEDERINDAGDNKEYRESHMRIREAMLEELEFRGFKGTALHLEQGKMTFDDVRSLFDQMNDVSTEEGKAKKALFEKVMAKVSKLPMEIALDETIDSNTGGWAGGRVIHYNWKYMNADYIANQAKADTILHELIHTVTAYADRCVEDGYEHLLDQDMVDAINELHSIYNAIEKDDTFVHNGVRAYGLWNVREMLSEAGSNSQFRSDLKKTGLWAKLKSGFLTFFGIKQNVQGGKQTTAYQEIMDRLDYLIENFKQEAWEEYYKGTRYGGYQRLDAQQRTQKRNAAQRRSAEAFARRQFERAKMRAKEWSDKLKIGDIMDVYESIDDVPGADRFLPRRRAARGWFDPDTGRITVVIGNHRNPDDIVTTILHEAVAHHGLRKLFGENFDNFLDNVYKSSDAQIKKAINELLPKYNGDKRRATEEYLATLAESTDFERAGTTSAIAHWFNNVKEQFLQMLAKIGLRDYRGVELSDNELRYILWRSYKNMEEPGRYRNRFNIPEVTAMEEKLGVGNGARIVRMGFIEDEIPAGAVTQNDVRKIRDRLSKMSLREAKAAYDRINAQMLDENGLNIDEHTDKVRLDWLAQHGREGVGKAMSDDLEALQNKYGSAMIVLRWELQERIEDLQKSNVREEPLFRDGIENDVEQNGLRGAVGDENYRKYMRDLWSAKGNPELHEWVTEHLAENDFNLYDTIDKYLKQAAENGEGSQEMWENVRDGLKEATGEKRMSLREARWLSWLSGRKGDRSNPDDSMKNSAVRWRIGRRRDTARLTPDGRSYAGVGPEADMTDEMAVGNTPQTNLAKLWYHRQLDSWATQWTEAYVDYAVSMKKLMFALSGAREVFDVVDDENFYVAENHMSSIVSQKEFQFMRDHWTPLQNAVDACLPDLDSDVEKAMSALEDYMRAKHGLERNREFFVRDWILAADKAQKRGLKNAPTVDLEQLRQDWEQEKRTAWSSLRAGRMTYRQYLETLDDFIKNNVDADWDSSLLKNDRSGIRNYAHQTDDAFEEADVISDIEDVERVLGDKADALWEAINDVTDYSLDSDYEAGLISKENRDHVGQMFHFYVPLRGFNEKVANEVYDYMGIPVSNPVGLATLMKAKGRKSLSDSPLAVMGAMATSAISRGERNKVKQKLLRLVRNRYNAKNKERLVSLSKIWLENIGTEDNPIWEERWPEFDENDSADEIARKVEDFNKDMEQKRAAGMAMPRRANLRIPYRAKEAEKRQHMVEVKENGESYLVIINGDPRAAQAMNGLLTPGNAEKNHTLGLLKPVLGPLNRFLSSAFTTWNPTFVLRNTLRDAIMSRSVVLTKEGEGYLMRFRANWYRLLWPELLNGRLWKKYRDGTLDESNFLEKCFKEFMEGGGETGYVEQKNVDKWRKMLLDGSKEYARKHGGFRRRAAYSTSQVAKAAVGLIEDYNERAENLARFATYLTSRQMGRSQLRSVADAKDVSVNFNRKGAGGSSADKSLLAGVTAELFKSLYLFFNAGMQSLALMARNIKKHPVRFMRAQFANHFVMGITIVMLNKWLVSVLGDDDTAENPYANLPEWTRRNNLCFFVGGNDWVTIPLPIELRAFYGLGDIAAGYFVDPELKSLKSPAEDFVAQLSQILPVDFMGEGGDVLSAFVPDAVKPLTQVKNNKDWTGKPIQKKESEWNKYDPEWTKAFRSTDKNVVGAARWLSNVTGGDNVRPGKVDISPAYALHILKGYTGGLGQTVTEAGGIIRDVAKWDFEDFNMRNVPLAKAVYNQSDDRTAFYRTRAKYYKYVEEVKKSKHYLSGYKKTAEDPMARAELIQMMRKDSMRNLIIDNAQKDLKKLQKAANQAQDRATRKRYEQLQYRVQEQAVRAVEGME